MTDSGCFKATTEAPLIPIADDDMENEIDQLESSALICRFLGIRPQISTLEAWAEKHWKSAGSFSITQYSNGYFLAVFPSEEIRDRIFQGGPWFLGRAGLFMKPWHSRFMPEDEFPPSAPVWGDSRDKKMYNSMKIPNRKTISVPAVKELADKDPNLLPERYIRSMEERAPSSTSKVNYTATTSIPIIDMLPLMAQHDDHHSRKREMDNLAMACQEWGFFQVVNHGIPESVLEGMKGIVRSFYQLPLEEKLKYGIQEREGYGQAFVVSDEQKLDWCDMFLLYTLPKNIRNMDFWPTEPVDFRNTLDEYSMEVETLYERLLRLIAETLCMKGDFFIKAGEWTQSLRMNFYPPCPRPDLVVGIAPHSDTGSLTILLQDDEALGLYISKDGQWVPVPPVPGALVVNFGDMLEVMSNGKYKSIEHMVVPNKEKDRISVAAFWIPIPEAQIGPHPDLVDDEHPAMFTSFRRGDFRKILVENKLQRKSALDCFRVGSPSPSS